MASIYCLSAALACAPNVIDYGKFCRSSRDRDLSDLDGAGQRSKAALPPAAP